jgi:heat shock protein HslJ
LTFPFGCAGDETISGYADPETTYVLNELDGASFAARATITFPEQGRAAGEAPCNSWSAEQSAPYPWFSLGPIAATRRACPELTAEGAYLSALAAMTLAEVQGGILILSNEDGRELVFEAAQD